MDKQYVVLISATFACFVTGSLKKLFHVFTILKADFPPIDEFFTISLKMLEKNIVHKLSLLLPCKVETLISEFRARIS